MDGKPVPAPAKVLWLIKGLGIGGAERLLTLAAPHVNRDRFEYQAAFLLPWKGALVEDLEKAGIRTRCLNHRSPFDLRVIGRIARLVREEKIDLLHLHLPYSGVVGRIAARLMGVPCVVYTEHNLQNRYHLLTRLANQATLRLCDLTIAVSDEVRDSLLRSPLSWGASVVAIPNGVDVEALQKAARIPPGVREEFGIPADRPIVGAVTVFRPQKRLDVWLQAARAIAHAQPRSTFFLVGDGLNLHELQGLAGRLGLGDRVIFTGLRRDAARLMAAFDVFMMSSIYEGLPVAALEAMALGRPIVATRVGGLPGLVQDGRHGFLVDAGDPAALAEKVVFLLEHPPLRRAMGEASAARIRESFSIQHMVRRTEQAYIELLRTNGRAGTRRPVSRSA
jgi:L-malate glycosyltransferase